MSYGDHFDGESWHDLSSQIDDERPEVCPEIERADQFALIGTSQDKNRQEHLITEAT
jgi:hypothetical protein